ncbi:nucleotidyl transferase AbiEii/AbiGii toxin family protein [Nodularia chucula]|uniref:nucleotidyl transferase AbiEii/AbiGii toxin family protein n=1 Tax=Nodularia chucula TaxID=3093667 RepID=UPI0039C5C19C
MNPNFLDFISLSTDERSDIFNLKSEQLNILPIYVEKDFWVCVALDILYNGLSKKEHPCFLFKGGTSLSKVYNLIERFSEDIDITIFREYFGFTGDKDPSTNEISGKQRRVLIQEVIEKTNEFVQGKLKDDLENIINTFSSECSLVLDDLTDDEKNPTLLLQYPSLFESENIAYVQSRIKLEFGGRSGYIPYEECTITPFIDDLFVEKDFSVGGITTLRPERTFWEKILILHGQCCRYRDEKKLPIDRNRLSRHYYDIAMISRTEIGNKAINNIKLQTDVKQHTEKFFKRAWMKLEEAIPGGFLIVPRDELLLNKFKEDYQDMQMMMLGEAPDFDTLVTDIKTLEEKINTIPDPENQSY